MLENRYGSLLDINGDVATLQEAKENGYFHVGTYSFGGIGDEIVCRLKDMDECRRVFSELPDENPTERDYNKMRSAGGLSVRFEK